MINIVFYFPSANLNVGQNTCPGATDNTELLTTQAECLYCPYRSSEFQGDVHSGMGFAKPRNDLRQQYVPLTPTAGWSASPRPGVRNSEKPSAACARMTSVRKKWLTRMLRPP